MQLFQRVKFLAKSKTGSAKALADKLGKAQSVFNAYLNESRQNNLWPLLPQILELYPDVSRDWLYFGEGEMLSKEPRANPQALIEENERLRAELESVQHELREVQRQNSKLINRFLLDGVGDKEGCAACGSEQAAQR